MFILWYYVINIDEIEMKYKITMRFYIYFGSAFITNYLL